MSEEWTIPALKAHFDECRRTDLANAAELRRTDAANVQTTLTAQKELTKGALDAAEKAIDKAEIAANNRFDAGNEIKGAMENAQKSFATITTTDAQRERMDRIEKDISDLRGRSAGAAQIIGYVLGAAGLGGLLVTVLSRGIG